MSENSNELLSEFGKMSNPPKNIIEGQKSECTPTSPIEQNEHNNMARVQWTPWAPNTYIAVSETERKLPPAVYMVQLTNQGECVFKRQLVCVDDFIEFPNSPTANVMKEIEVFWNRGTEFKKHGFLHRRGYLIYGPAGGGKSCAVQQIMHKIISGGDIVMLCGSPALLASGLAAFRSVEPDRKIVCVFEDIDAIKNRYGEESLLSLLDGETQIQRVLNIATTNYPELLDKRLVARPRRFDRIIKIGMPSAEVRRIYLEEKLKITNGEAMDWVEKTEGLSFASLAELVISVKCLGNDFESTLKILRAMSLAKSSSQEFAERKLGFSKDQEAYEAGG